jgi:hypothetical protein
VLIFQYITSTLPCTLTIQNNLKLKITCLITVEMVLKTKSSLKLLILQYMYMYVIPPTPVVSESLASVYGGSIVSSV